MALDSMAYCDHSVRGCCDGVGAFILVLVGVFLVVGVLGFSH